MKKILIVDWSGKCSHCRFCYADQSWLNTTFLGETRFCAAAKECRELPEDGKEDSPDWCPLQEAPERLNTSYPTAYEKIVTPEAWEIYRTGFEDGFNECLTQILGTED